MPLNNEYKRYFIILQEDDKGYEMAAGKIPTGYVKIEIKNGRGKLTAYAQNVKYGEKVDYRMLLIAPVKKAAVDMGRLMVDGTGRGELNIEFDADNVMKSGMDISEFMVAAVQASTATPLSGYTGRDKVQWKNSYHVINKPQDRIDKQQTIQEVVTPVETQPAVMPQLPKVDLDGVGEVIGNVIEEGKELLGNVVEGAKDLVGDVVEGAKDVVQDFMGDVVDSAKDAVSDLAQGAKNIVGEIKQGVGNVMEYVVDENDVVPVQPMAMPSIKKETAPLQTVTGPVTMQPTPIIPKKETVPIQTVPGPVAMQPIIQPAPVKPKKEPVPIQVVTEPVVMQPIVQPEPIPVPEPIVEPAPAPVTPIQMMPQKPLFEAQTEIKAKFVIETETQHEHHKPQYVCEEECPKLDYKDYYYDDECECDSDSDSDSDSDDRDKKKKHHEHDEHCEHHDHHDDHDHHVEEEEIDYEKHPFYSSPMYRRLEKVLGRLRDTEPFEDDDSKERWYKVEDDIYLLNSVTIPFMGSLMPLGYPFMSNECVMMIGRKDYVLGAKYIRGRKDKKYINAIMFGIPGMYNKQEERYYSMRGFTHFRPHKSKNHGYWIMVVDLENGEIVMK